MEDLAKDLLAMEQDTQHPSPILKLPKQKVQCFRVLTFFCPFLLQQPILGNLTHCSLFFPFYTSNPSKAQAQEAPMPSKTFYGAVDPTLALKVLKQQAATAQTPTLKGHFKQNILLQQKQQLKRKNPRVISFAMGSLAAKILQRAKRLQEHCFAGTTSLKMSLLKLYKLKKRNL